MNPAALAVASYARRKIEDQQYGAERNRELDEAPHSRSFRHQQFQPYQTFSRLAWPVCVGLDTKLGRAVTYREFQGNRGSVMELLFGLLDRFFSDAIELLYRIGGLLLAGAMAYQDPDRRISLGGMLSEQIEGSIRLAIQPTPVNSPDEWLNFAAVIGTTLALYYERGVRTGHG